MDCAPLFYIKCTSLLRHATTYMHATVELTPRSTNNALASRRIHFMHMHHVHEQAPAKTDSEAQGTGVGHRQE
jgi:hypothetical protein